MKIAELLGKLWLQVLLVGLFLLLIISKTRFKYFEELFIVSVLGYSISLLFISVLRKRHKGSGYASLLIILALSFLTSVYAGQFNDKDKMKAKDTLINFFTYLHDGRFEEAVPLFKPWENAEGEHRSSWEGLASFSILEERADKAKVLSNYCKAVGTCLNVDVINIEKIAKGKYKLRVQFFKDNGSVYIYGPCCGATEEAMPLRAVFTYYVHKINGVYLVRTPPLYRP